MENEIILALYRIAHEGISTGAVIGLGRISKRWLPEMIIRLSNTINSGLPVYLGHSMGKRSPIGYVVKSFSRQNSKSVEAFIIARLTHQEYARQACDRRLDAASIEADLSLEPTETGWNVADVHRVTGIALANSRGHSPGFERAGLMRTLTSPPNEVQ